MKNIAFMFFCLSLIGNDAHEVLAKYREARGGANWDKIQTIKITGTFTSFSVVSPFTILRKRPDFYFVDQEMNNHPVTIGHDGKTSWWVNQMLNVGATEVAGLDLQVLKRDVHFISRLYDCEKEGFSVAMGAATEVDGLPCVSLVITRGEETETWFLDPETYLEIACDSAGSDFGSPAPQRTFFDDFREVNGVMIPHYVEAQFYTRNRVMEVDAVEVNLTVDDAVFAMPLPPGMDVLKHLEGSFAVSFTPISRRGPGEPVALESTIQSELRGGLLQERYVDQDGDSIVRQYTYDPYDKTYRVLQIDSRQTQMSVMEGSLNEEGVLVVDNLKSDTPSESFGQKFFLKLSLSNIAETGFQLDYEMSRDEGKTWFPVGKAAYTRK
ncbi:MAG: hypothetical protein KDC35_03870 [Acidobacteria bacterium]|nr:hypothetical protein [Acidobacteriota bacterium]